MKICIVIQSEAFRTSAGMRIRYDRFRDSLEGSDVTIDALTTAELSDSDRLDHDVYVFCKTFDTAALLLARRVRAAGKVVGQDLFDDYFSQYGDARLERFRQWMRDMAPVTQFCVCSTQQMVAVLKAYMPAVPIVAIEDPYAPMDVAHVTALADVKLATARENGVIDVVWFGIGDNPYFPVGLTDLAACDPEFARMERQGWTVRLRIVTNRRPFEGVGAEALRRLSVGYELVEWTEEAEREALESAAVAIIPVNGQSFSRAKSTNRAVTALNAGCQVLSLGYPLYAPLDDFIYRSTDALLDDVKAGTARVRGNTIGSLNDRLSAMADPAEAAARFVDEARGAMAAQLAADGRAPLVCLLHGRSSTIALHKAVGALGGLSVGTIFSKAAWNFPVRFDRVGGEIRMRTTPQLATRHGLPLIAGARPVRILTLELVDVDTVALGTGKLEIGLPDQISPIMDLAIYEDVMRFARDCCYAAFADADILISDHSPFSRRPRSRASDVPARRRARPRAGAATAGSAARTPAGSDWSLRKIGRGRADRRAAERGLAIIAKSGLFDREWYLQRYPDVAASGMDAARHYFEFGWREGRNPGPSFSTRAYLDAHVDVATQGINPLLHYVEFGHAEGRAVVPAEKGARPR